MHPYQAIDHPLEPPGPDMGPVCLTFDAKWIPALTTVLKALIVESTWETEQIRATGEASLLLEVFQKMTACALPGSGGIEMDEDMCGCIRWSDDGVLQVFTCGQWTDVPGPAGAATANGPSIPRNAPQPAPGGCENFIGKVLFYGRWLLPVPVDSGDQITVTNAFGATTDYIIDYPAWRCGDGLEFIANGCVSGTAIFNGTDPAPAYHHANLIGFDGTNHYDFGEAANSVPVTVTIAPGISGANFEFLINSPGPAGAGDNSFDVRICKALAAPISISYPVGSGPAAVADGATFTVNAAVSGGHSQVTLDFGSQCVKFTVLSFSNFVANTGGGLTAYDYFDCASSYTAGPTETSGFVPTDFPAATEVHEVGIAGDASGVFSLVVKVEKV